MKIIKFLFIVLLLTSCQEWDYGIDSKDIEYRTKFEQEFGKIPENQEWDFYRQSIENFTRAAESYTINNATYDNSIDYDLWRTYLQNGRDNRNVGIHDYTLTANGDFYVYTAWYGGWYEYYAKYGFEFGIYFEGEHIKLFDGMNKWGPESSDPNKYSLNPKLAKEVNLGYEENFVFYIKCNGNTLYSNTGYSALLYSNTSDDKQVMLIGFEDTPSSKWDTTTDFNDVVIYVVGNPNLPVPFPKRFFCEDLGKIGDFDYNDIVFDICQNTDGETTDVTIEAVGGTLPIYLYVNDILVGKELHSLFSESTETPINVGVGVTKSPQVVNLSTYINNLTEFENIYAIVYYNTGVSKRIDFSNNEDVPAIITVPNNTKWMKEDTNIKLGYPNFFSEYWYNTYNLNYLVK